MIAFIVNPVSASGRGKRVWSQLDPILKKRHVSYVTHVTERPKHAIELTKAILQDKKVEAVVAVGGDGTVHEVAQELVGTGCPLGFIPCGSGNDFARAMHIPADPMMALERVLAKQSYKIDIARVNDHVFVNGIGVGFDAAVAKVTNESADKQWLNRLKLGRYVYFLHALRLLATFHPTDMVITIDGQEIKFEHVWLVAVCNIPYYAGGMKICPDAIHDDGLLNVCIVHNMGRIQLLQNLAKVYDGGHTSARGVTMLHAKTLCVHPMQTQYVHTDGESYLTSPVKITVHKEGLRVL